MRNMFWRWMRVGVGFGIWLAGAELAAQKKPDTRLDSIPVGAVEAAFPQIAAAGEHVYVVWEDQRRGRFEGDIYFNRSLDGGATWLPQELRLDSPSGGEGRSQHPRISAAGDAVYVVWQDNRSGGGFDIYFNRSLDAGATWLPTEIRLDTDLPASGRSENPQLVSDGPFVYVVWKDDRNGGLFGEDIYFNRSLDGGTTWLSSDVRVDTDVPGSAESKWPTIAASGDCVYVVWQDHRVGRPSIYFNRSLDRGATWQATDLRLDTDKDRPALSPQVVATADSVYVVWSLDTGPGIFLNRSRDRGASWLSSDRRVNQSLERAFSPRVAAHEESVYVVWQDWRNRIGDIYLNRSRDGGGSWQSSDTRVNVGLPSGDLSTSQEIAVSGNRVHVVWQENPDRDPRDWNVHFNRSLDGGASWLDSPPQLDDDLPEGSYATRPRLTPSQDSVYVTWTDRTVGKSGVYFNIPFGAQPYGDATPGSGGFAPRLEVSDNLNIGNTATLNITNALGGAFGLLALGGPNSKSAIPFLGGTLRIDPIDTIIPIRLEGPLNAPGAGTISIDCPIPDDPAFLGFNINFQALIIDPGAANSVTWTNAVEGWIL